ncbi:MAG TPA: serine/threonine-protein kinase, partial [Pyrinomonadaceae bacterium]
MSANWQVGDYIRNDYKVLSVLKGGMGIIYIVYSHKHQRVFAVKTFRDEALDLDPQIPERFSQEALAWINMGAHPHVTQALFVYDIGHKPHLFLEFVEGGDASRWRGSSYLTGMLPRVVRLATQFCDGMSHALSSGVTAHRDIKPQNCLITRYGKLKVTDFGLAKVFDDLPGATARAGGIEGTKIFRWMKETTYRRRRPSGDDETLSDMSELSICPAGGTVVGGTPAYMAPEQFRESAAADARSDIYSFGITLYQMLSGRLPFDGHSWEALEEQHHSQPPPELPNVNAEVSAVVGRCLAKDPADRFQSFSELREQLAGVYERVSGRPVPLPMPVKPLTEADWAIRGLSLMELRRDEAALACFDKALALNDRIAGTWWIRGTVLFSLERFDEALSSFERALEINPSEGRAWHSKGTLLATRGQAGEAITCYERALELNPDDAVIWHNIGLARRETGDAAKALVCFDQAIKLDSNYVGAWRFKGRTLKELGRTHEAR